MPGSKTKKVNALLDLSVHFISLVEHPANKRQFLVKQAALEDGVEIVEKTVRIVKSHSKRRVAYGIALAHGYNGVLLSTTAKGSGTGTSR